MNDQVDFPDLEPDDRDTARALLAAFDGVGLHRPSPVRAAAEDAHTAALLELAFDGVRLDRTIPGGAYPPAASPARPAPRMTVLRGRSTRRRRSRVWLSGAAAAVMALALTLSLAPGGSSGAWAAEPSTPTSADEEAAAAACGAPLARGLGDLESSGSASTDGSRAPAPGEGPVVPESLPPLAVLDIRGDGALAIYQDPTWQVTCLLARDGSAWVDQGISVGPGPSTSTPGVIFGSRTTWMGGGSVAYLGGTVPPGTTKVTFDLSDGTTVQASLLGTTFAAWFPGERSYVPGSLMTYDANSSPPR
jgi:hypothetical protein